MRYNLPLLRECGEMRGKRVLLRLDLNLPIADGKVSDAFRFARVLRTLKFLQSGCARTIIVSHIESKGGDSLLPVFKFLLPQLPIVFSKTLVDAKEKLAQADEGSFVLLENLRQFAGERENSDRFAGELASLADIFVNEAFSASHRPHASIIGVPKFLPSYAGFLFEEEIEHLSRAFSPGHPALAILGGAKFETKMPLIKKFLESMDHVYICGALANDIYKARGYETGVSLVSASLPDAAVLENPKLQTPSDVVVRVAGESREKGSDAVEKEEKIVDAGSDALFDVRSLIEKAKFVLWNGPLGEYESGFDAGTIAVAQALAESDAESIIGGGDSLAVVSKLGLLERFSFVSTGGGASLQFLANETLPGIEALQGSFQV